MAVELEEHPPANEITEPASEVVPPPPAPEPPRRRTIPMFIKVPALIVALIASGVVGGFVARGGNGVVTINSPSRPAGQTASGSIAAGFEGAYRKIAPSVVEVITSGNRQGANGSGTGVIIDADGRVVTNAHVVTGGNIEVVMADGTRTAATVMGRDTEGDLALLKLTDPPDGLKAATLGDSSAVSVGQPVAAIGSPFGLESSLSAGVISGLGRTFSERPTGVPLRGLLQTDAPINPGNSGGPLINQDGEVLGINTAIESPVQGSVGIGFAIPINQLKDELSELAAGRTVTRPFLGIEGTDVQGGIQIVGVVRGSTADAAGLKEGDVIVSLGDRQTNKVDDLADELSKHKVGDKIDLVYKRGGGQETKITVELKGSSS